MSINRIRSWCYSIAIALGDANAVVKNRVPRRIARRLVGKIVGRMFARIFG
jgi:hypothetical protein